MSNDSESSRDAVFTTAVVHADLYADHDTGAGHPESPERYHAVIDELRNSRVAGRLQWLAPRPAEADEILLCHSQEYIDLVQRDIALGLSHLSTGDTSICSDSWEPSLHAAGGACVAVDTVFEGKAPNAFLVARPPGHHASPDRGMGFCVFNNIAIAARYAQQRHGVGKVLIVDWDVHHGNGTQDAFYADDSVLFFSTHQHPWYPGTGRRDETGTGKGLGTTINRPFTHGAGRPEILGTFQSEMLEAAREFKPEFVLVSAGFDSRHDDPLGGFLLSDQDFADLTDLMLELADEFADGRIVSMLEGGYNVEGLAKAASSHCERLALHGGDRSSC